MVLSLLVYVALIFLRLTLRWLYRTLLDVVDDGSPVRILVTFFELVSGILILFPRILVYC